MSATTPQPMSRRAQRRAARDQRRTDRADRRDTRRAVRQGRKVAKAGLALAAANVRRMDPAIREQIGRANLTAADLQVLATASVNARFDPGRYGQHAQALVQEVQARVAQAGPAPRNNAITRANPLSRWNRNQRAGTKALKQGFTQAARDAKNMNPTVAAAIGRSGFTPVHLASMASGRVESVFQQPGRGQQQGQQGAGRVQGAGPAQQPPGPAQMTQARNATQQGPAPQQVNPHVQALQQQIIALQRLIDQQNARITLLEENNLLQASMRETLQAQAQVQQTGQQSPPAAPAVDQSRQQGPEQQTSVQQPGDQTIGEAEPPAPSVDEAETGEAGVGEAAVGEAAAGEAGVGEGEPRAVAAPELGGAQVEGGELEQPEPTRGEQWAASARGDNEFNFGDELTAADEAAQAEAAQAGVVAEPEVSTEEPAAETSEPAVAAQGPSVDPAQPTQAQPQVAGQQPQVAGQQPQVAGQQPQGAGLRGAAARAQQAAPGKSAGELDGKFAMQHALGGSAPLNKVSPEKVEGAVDAGDKDTSTRPRTGQTAKTKTTPAKNER